MRRKVIAEMLDQQGQTPAEVASSLVDLRHINAWFGGTHTTLALLKTLIDETGYRALSMLEVGAGGGEVPLAAQRALAKKGVKLQIALMDRIWSHLPSEATASVAGDALQLPFRDGAFDVVSCTLFAHHLEPEELRTFVCDALRVCRRAVLINDVLRSRLHLWLVYAGLPLFRSRLTWHDAPASVRRAYTLEEMHSMLQGLPAQRVVISKHHLYRMGVVLWKAVLGA